LRITRRTRQGDRRRLREFVRRDLFRAHNFRGGISLQKNGQHGLVNFRTFDGRDGGLTYVFGARYQGRREANNQGVDIRIGCDYFNGALVLFGAR